MEALKKQIALGNPVCVWHAGEVLLPGDALMATAERGVQCHGNNGHSGHTRSAIGVVCAAGVLFNALYTIADKIGLTCRSDKMCYATMSPTFLCDGHASRHKENRRRHCRRRSRQV